MADKTGRYCASCGTEYPLNSKHYCIGEERMRKALAVEPESLNVGQLNQAVKDLRELVYQKQLRIQELQAEVTALENWKANAIVNTKHLLATIERLQNKLH